MMQVAKRFKKYAGRKYVFLGLLCVALMGCETPQSITIETTPAGAAISVDSEYIGKSPVVFDIDDTHNMKRLHIVAEKQSHESTLKLIKKKSTGFFPERVFLKLDPSMSAAEIKTASGSANNQQSTTIQGPTIQGPTIVVPGSSGTQVTPAPAPSTP